MAKTYYPVALDVHAKRCLVVGGGTIAAEKVEGLLAAGAEVVVVSPSVLPPVARHAAEGEIALHQRVYRDGDLDGVFMAIAATDDMAVNAEIARQARARNILVNAVDDPPYCDFFAMAILRRGDLQIAISTNGHSPAFARWMREDLETRIPEEYGDLVAVLSEVRRQVRETGPLPVYQHWKDALTDEVLSQIGSGDIDGARARIHAAIAAASAARRDEDGAPARWSA